MMRIRREEEILDPAIRKRIINEINGPENIDRKKDKYKRYLSYKDQTFRFVVEELEKQFDRTTVNEMSYAISNVAFSRKIIDKLARVYSNGVNREVLNPESGKKDDKSTENLQKLADRLDANSQIKTLNRLLKLQRTIDMYVKPCPYFDSDGNVKHRIKLEPVNPYLYDVVEEFYDRTKPLVYILSNFDHTALEYSTIDAAREGRGINTTQLKRRGDGKDQVIADTAEDEDGSELDKKQYIWWCDKYHFTTNGRGEMLNAAGEASDMSVEEILNPIEKKPFVNFAIDRDNSFWSIGGDDLSMGAISLNTALTHVNHIGNLQGYGQAFMKGKNLPTNVAVGTSKIIKMEYEEGQPEPQFGFVSANPQLAQLMRLVEMRAALLLSTNNLSTSGLKTALDSNNFAAGIALMIDKAESMEDVHDQEQIFIDNEPLIWDLVNRWIKIYAEDSSLDPELDGLVLPDDFDVSVHFPSSKIIESESERLGNLKTRKDLGINTMIDIIKMDQPDLTDEQAEEKLLKISEEKSNRMASMLVNPEPFEEEDDNGNSEEDEINEE